MTAKLPSSSFPFTFESYEQLLERFVTTGYDFVGYNDTPSCGDIILRHDVDFSPAKAVRMAEIESQVGANATYFFLVSAPHYNVFHRKTRDLIEEIQQLGHEVALHFDTHSYWETSSDESVVAERVLSECHALSEVTGSHTTKVSFHNPPEWVLDRVFSQFTSAYEPRFFSEISYAADSNHRWRDSPPFSVVTPEVAQILTHPVLWSDDDQHKNELLETVYEQTIEEIAARIDAARLE